MFQVEDVHNADNVEMQEAKQDTEQEASTSDHVARTDDTTPRDTTENMNTS